jgi:signal transduction histidine kinase
VIGFAFAVAGATFGVGLLAILALRLLPTMRLQLGGLALLAVLLPLLAVLLSGWVMFHMGDDVKILAVAAAAASAAVAAALALGTSIARRVERLGAASARLAAGELSARAPEEGPRELRALGRSFNEMASSLESLFDVRRELVVAASHDLRTPIASISAMLEAIEDGLAEPSEYLGPLRDEAHRLTRLIEDLFDLARIDSGALAHELRGVALAPLVESCLRGFEAEARARSVRLERRLEPAPDALCAPEQVERVLLNLLTNALRHTPPDGTVAVLLAPAEGGVCVTVEDDGEGITYEIAQRMFDRFWRSDSARTRDAGGAGLGLAIARGLVESQGGRMWAEPRDPRGARVSFTLPSYG